MDTNYQKIESLLLSGDKLNIELGFQLAVSQSIDLSLLLEDMALMVNFLIVECGEHLAYNQLEELPWLLANIVEIQVDYSRLSGVKSMQLPDKFQYLPNLEQIELIAVGLQSLPASIGTCRRLKKLFVADNQLTELPATFEGLPLTILNMSKNPLSEIPSVVYSLENLQDLIVKNCKISRISDRVGALGNLLNLDLSNNLLTKLSSNFGRLRKLEALALEKNQIQVLPEQMGTLENLRTLILLGNPIQKIPDSFKLLTKLDFISIDNIPEGLFNLRSISYLYINLYKAFDASLIEKIGQLKWLEKLEIRNFYKENEPIPFPITFTKLQEFRLIFIQGVPFNAFPDEMKNLTNLKRLTIYAAKLPDLFYWRKYMKTLLPTCTTINIANV